MISESDASSERDTRVHVAWLHTVAFRDFVIVDEALTPDFAITSCDAVVTVIGRHAWLILWLRLSFAEGSSQGADASPTSRHASLRCTRIGADKLCVVSLKGAVGRWRRGRRRRRGRGKRRRRRRRRGRGKRRRRRRRRRGRRRRRKGRRRRRRGRQ